MKYTRIQIGMSPPYPSNNQMIAAAELYRVTVMNNTLVPDKILHQRVNRYIELFVCGGEGNRFLVTAKPPAGFVVKNPEQVPGLQTSIARVFEYDKPKHTYSTVASSPPMTEAVFKTFTVGLCQEA